MNFTVRQIADQINGTIVGDSDVNIIGISKIEEGSKGSLTFLANPKYTEYIYSTNASAANWQVFALSESLSLRFHASSRNNFTARFAFPLSMRFAASAQIFFSPSGTPMRVAESALIENRNG